VRLAATRERERERERERRLALNIASACPVASPFTIPRHPRGDIRGWNKHEHGYGIMSR